MASTGAHVAEVTEQGAFAHAVCRACGWTGPGRRSRVVAARDAQEHDAGRSAGPEPQLVR